MGYQRRLDGFMMNAWRAHTPMGGGQNGRTPVQVFVFDEGLVVAPARFGSMRTARSEFRDLVP
jgi:hypothetical protein